MTTTTDDHNNHDEGEEANEVCGLFLASAVSIGPPRDARSKDARPHDEAALLRPGLSLPTLGEPAQGKRGPARPSGALGRSDSTLQLRRSLRYLPSSP